MRMSVASAGVFGPPLEAASLEGLVAVVTGASRGLGLGLCRRFGQLGLRLGMCARHEPVPPDPPGPRGALCRAVDVTDPGEVERFALEVIGRFGRIDLWVNNAGVLEPIGPLADADPLAIRHLFEVDVGGVVHGTQAFCRHVRSRPGGGVLVNVTSGAAVTPYAGWAPYCAAKAAVDQLTRVIAVEEAANGLRALAVAPGLVDTDMQATIRATPAERFPAVGRFLRAKAAGSFNSPGWVADAVVELAFGAAAPETVGQDVVVRVPDEPRHRHLQSRSEPPGESGPHRGPERPGLPDPRGTPRPERGARWPGHDGVW